MSSEIMSPTAVVIEGPAGSGKTFLATRLLKFLANCGVRVSLCPEFSPTQFGTLLAEMASYGEQEPSDAILGFSGVMRFLADKMFMFEAAAASDMEVCVFDRGFITQLILGLWGVPSLHQQAAERVIMSLHRSSVSLFSNKSQLLFVNPDRAVIQARLMERTGAALTSHLLSRMEYEFERYEWAQARFWGWPATVFGASSSTEQQEELFLKLYGRICS